MIVDEKIVHRLSFIIYIYSTSSKNFLTFSINDCPNVGFEGLDVCTGALNSSSTCGAT
ncbi:hypothetical protein [Chryseobacterium indoltheticum]|uniref:hypothetical protein n=1 Tax=Chryseobacterium indoltheticum TaxID=254 RepID=UPI003F493ED9